MESTFFAIHLERVKADLPETAPRNWFEKLPETAPRNCPEKLPAACVRSELPETAPRNCVFYLSAVT
eukprot:10738512-Karenia_brevis.AAC.1